MKTKPKYLNRTIALSIGMAAFATVQTQGAILVGGANTAWDNASAYAYDDGWQTGDNGGFGWGAWTLTTSGSNSGHFIGTSTANGNGLDDGIVGGVPNDWDIDTTTGPIPDQSGSPDPNSTGHRSWGMYANSGEQANAYRDFLGGGMAVGQTFSMDFDNGYLQAGAAVGLGLQNAAGITLWEVYFAGGGTNYFNNDASGANATTVGYGDEGVNVTFTLTGSNAYTATLTRRDGVTQTINGNLISNADQTIHHLRAFNANAGSGTPSNAYFNIPEPTSAMLGLLGTALLLRRRRL